MAPHYHTGTTYNCIPCKVANECRTFFQFYKPSGFLKLSLWIYQAHELAPTKSSLYHCCLHLFSGHQLAFQLRFSFPWHAYRTYLATAFWVSHTHPSHMSLQVLHQIALQHKTFPTFCTFIGLLFWMLLFMSPKTCKIRKPLTALGTWMWPICPLSIPTGQWTRLLVFWLMVKLSSRNILLWLRETFCLTYLVSSYV